MNFKEQYEVYLTAFEHELARHCGRMSFQPPVLAESMRYSLLAGGKRIRPVLFYAVLDALGYDYLSEGELAVAIECIHTYSLIHDDLPAMDNDDFRRGKPSNHRVFGEANAILAGDALLSYAFDLLLKECARGEKHLQAAQMLSEAAGPCGMVAGQSADLLYEKKAGDKTALDFIYRNKTGRLLETPARMAAVIAGRCEEEISSFGACFGYLFQITDDILDVKGDSASMGKTLGKDEAVNKLTCVKIYGIEGSERLADSYAEQCKRHISAFCGGEFLSALVDFARRRDH